MRAILVKHRVGGIELAPLKYWPTAPDVPSAEVSAYRDFWNEAGIEIVAMQGILFGKPDLLLFGSDQQRDSLTRFLLGLAKLAAALGARAVVLGAPANRRRGAISHAEAVERAAPLLQRVGAGFADAGCVLAIEPNPPRYGTDFGCTIAEVRAIVNAVDHPGVGLHLDAGAIAIEHETAATVTSASSAAQHFHVSEVDLVPVGAGSVDHAAIGAWLREGGYARWHSIEMKPTEAAVLEQSLEFAIETATRAYLAP